MNKFFGHDDDDIDPDGETERPTRKSQKRFEEDVETESFKGDEAEQNHAESSDDGDNQDSTVRYPKRKKGSAQEATTAASLPSAGAVFPCGWIVVIDGDAAGEAFPILSGTNKVGRESGNDIALPGGDRTLSRKDHARISYNRKSRIFRLIPGEGNETWLRGDLLEVPVTIEAGETITFGETVTRFMPFCGPDFDWSDDTPSAD